MQLHYNPGIARPVDGQTAPVGVASGKHWQECRHQWKILGGCDNTTGGSTGATLVGGMHNEIRPSADAAFLGGGQDNLIENSAVQNFLGGGFMNNSSGQRSVLVGGESNTIVGPSTNHHSFIGGGIGNVINSACSVIVGGENNNASGAFSAILGGSGNNDGGFAFTGIYGNGVVGQPLVSGLGGFFVNELVIQNIPVITTPLAWSTLAFGEVYTTVPPNTGLGASPLFIR